MKVLILAAGYGKRMEHITKGIPKCMLNINGNPTIDYIIKSAKNIKDIGEIILITNKEYFNILDDNCSKQGIKVIINEGIAGSINTLRSAIKKKNINEPLMILTSDNIITFSLDYVAKLFKQKESLIVVDKIVAKNKNYGVIGLEGERIISYEKKYVQNSEILRPIVYCYGEDLLIHVENYLKAGLNSDDIGSFIGYMCKIKNMFCYITEGQCFDIGNEKSYKDTLNIFRGLQR